MNLDGHFISEIFDQVIKPKHHELKINISARVPLINIDKDKIWFIGEPSDFDKSSNSFTNIHISCYNMPAFYINIHSNLILQVLETKKGVIFKTGYFPGYSIDNEFRDIVDSKKYAELNAHPSGEAFKSLPLELKEAIPSYVKDNVNLERLENVR